MLVHPRRGSLRCLVLSAALIGGGLAIAASPVAAAEASCATTLKTNYPHTDKNYENGPEATRLMPGGHIHPYQLNGTAGTVVHVDRVTTATVGPLSAPVARLLPGGLTWRQANRLHNPTQPGSEPWVVFPFEGGYLHTDNLTGGPEFDACIAALNAPAPADPPPAPLDPPPAARSGYWMVSSDGAVYAFGDAVHYGNAHTGERMVDIEATPSGNGYWVLSSTGQVHAFGDASASGGGWSAAALRPGEEVTAISAVSANAYWLFSSHGRVLAVNAPHHGSMDGTQLNGPVLDAIPTPDHGGYYMVGSDGGIFTFGNAVFAGSMGGISLNAAVQSLVPDGDGHGYWLVASDGGLFSFDAPFYGSMGDQRLNRPVSGMVAFGSAGYLMVAEDGGIFTFGQARFHGSLGDSPSVSPIVSVTVLD